MIVDTVERLEQIYGRPKETSVVKEVDRLTDEYRAIVEASPFAVLATAGPEGLDCSPRGDRPGFIRVADDKTLILPDRRGNNRIDALRNIVSDPRVALLFLVPGLGLTLRINGRAGISAEAELLASFSVEGEAPRTALIIGIEAVYFQCARAILRSRLWEAEARVDPASLPSAGDMLAAITQARLGGENYDREWPEIAKKTLW